MLHWFARKVEPPVQIPRFPPLAKANSKRPFTSLSRYPCVARTVFGGEV